MTPGTYKWKVLAKQGISTLEVSISGSFFCTRAG